MGKEGKGEGTNEKVTMRGRAKGREKRNTNARSSSAA
jgi:hypothetical protein